MAGVDDRLVDEIYEAALVPERWPSVLDEVARISESWAGGIIALDPDQRPRGIWTETYAPTYESFARGESSRYENVRAQRALARRHQGFLRDIDLCSLEELQVDPLYRHFLHPYGLGWTVGTFVNVPTMDLVIFDFARKADDGPHNRSHVSVLDGYRPHLARAAFLSARLGLERARSMTAAMDALGVPAAVFGGSGKIMAANSDWEALWPRVERTFRKVELDGLPNRIVGRSSAPAGRVRSIPIAGTASEAPLIIHVLPVCRSALDVFSGASQIVVITPVRTPAAPPVEIISGLFDLSPAEARIARALAEGRTIDGCATDFRVSTETVRKQVRSIMSKTGTNRQVDLVRLLLGASPPPAARNP